MAKPVGIVRFLGTNCDRDIWQAVEAVGGEPTWLWYQDQFDSQAFSGLIVPGGFSYGDYLRCGALSAKAPVMKSVAEAAKRGIPILGICNGFQILCESGLLPGALVRNESLRFIDKWVDLLLQNPSAPWGGSDIKKTRLPIAHGEGRFYVEDNDLKRLQDAGQVWLTYGENPNGSVENIAGVLNETKTVAGLMPHPERAMFDWMGGSEGRAYFESVLGSSL